MIGLIGKTLKGTIAGEEASFEVIRTHDELEETFLILECVEFGAPNIRININDINEPVRG